MPSTLTLRFQGGDFKESCFYPDAETRPYVCVAARSVRERGRRHFDVPCQGGSGVRAVVVFLLYAASHWRKVASDPTCIDAIDWQLGLPIVRGGEETLVLTISNARRRGSNWAQALFGSAHAVGQLVRASSERFDQGPVTLYMKAETLHPREIVVEADGRAVEDPAELDALARAVEGANWKALVQPAPAGGATKPVLVRELLYLTVYVPRDHFADAMFRGFEGCFAPGTPGAIAGFRLTPRYAHIDGGGFDDLLQQALERKPAPAAIVGTAGSSLRYLAQIDAALDRGIAVFMRGPAHARSHERYFTIGQDETEIGRLLAATLLSDLKRRSVRSPARVARLVPDEDWRSLSEAPGLRYQAFDATISRRATMIDVRCPANLPYVGSLQGTLRDVAVETAEVLTRTLPELKDIDAIVSPWGIYTDGILRALLTLGRRDAPPVYSVDITQTMLDELADPASPLQAAVGVDPTNLGRFTGNMVLKYFNAKTVRAQSTLRPVALTKEVVKERQLFNTWQLVREYPELWVTREESPPATVQSPR